jgi:CheY-like chemotaxis protein
VSKVLLVEDDPWLAELQVSALEKAGYEVVHAPHAPSAIVKVDDFEPDIIVTDILLTGSTAFALLHELQSYGDTGQLPVIVCTNMAEALDKHDLAAYGVRRIIDKSSMKPGDLAAAVTAVLA